MEIEAEEWENRALIDARTQVQEGEGIDCEKVVGVGRLRKDDNHVRIGARIRLAAEELLVEGLHSVDKEADQVRTRVRANLESMTDGQKQVRIALVAVLADRQLDRLPGFHHLPSCR